MAKPREGEAVAAGGFGETPDGQARTTARRGSSGPYGRLVEPGNGAKTESGPGFSRPAPLLYSA